jgi:hypothetical protein
LRYIGRKKFRLMPGRRVTDGWTAEPAFRLTVGTGAVPGVPWIAAWGWGCGTERSRIGASGDHLRSPDLTPIIQQRGQRGDKPMRSPRATSCILSTFHEVAVHRQTVQSIARSYLPQTSLRSLYLSYLRLQLGYVAAFVGFEQAKGDVEDHLWWVPSRFVRASSSQCCRHYNARLSECYTTV